PPSAKAPDELRPGPARPVEHAQPRQAEPERQHDRERQRRAAEHAPPRGRGLADEPRMQETAREHDRRDQVEPADDGERGSHGPFTENVKWPSVGCVSTETTAQVTV